MTEPWKAPAMGQLRSEDSRPLTQTFSSLTEKLKEIDDAIAAGTGVTSVSAGTGISVAGTSAVTVTNAGVTGLTGTANQVTVSASTGSVTVSLPQNIHSGATPTFGGMTLTGDFSGTKVYASDWFRPTGQAGIYFESYGSGLRQTEGAWIRTYGSAGIWAGGASIGTDGGVCIQTGGPRSYGLHNNGNSYFGARAYANEWIQFDNFTGIYSGAHNNAHFRPNPATFGSWQAIGERNGWRGIEFDQSGWGMTLMMGVNYLGVGSQINGVHANGYGWMWYNQWTAMYAGSYNGLSTITIKQDVKDFEDDALEIIKKFREVDFQYKNGTTEAMSNNQGTFAERNIGFIAEEMNDVFPEAVAMDPSGTEPKAISLMTLMPLFSKAIKQLDARLEALENV